MLIRLIRNQPQGSAITGRLVINGRWFCNTLERVGYQIPAICYPIRVTQSPRFKRLLPLVCNVPQRSGIRFHVGKQPKHSTGCILIPADKEKALTDLILNTQNAHEEIILEVIDFRPGTEYGYNTQCPSSECACEKEIRSANFARLHSSSILEAASFSDDC